MAEYVRAEQFEAECLKLVDKVCKTRRKIVMTKRNKPVAQLVPVEEGKSESLFGKMKSTFHIVGDILSPISEELCTNSAGTTTAHRRKSPI